MAREIDARKTRKALRKIRKAALLAEQGLGPELTDWEKEFLESMETRLDTYGSAFHDLEKGAADDPLSVRQQVKLREIDRKARGKPSKRTGFSSFKPKRPKPANMPEPIATLDDASVPDDAPPKLHVIAPTEQPSPPKPTKRAGPPKLKIISGGADKA